VWCCHSGLFPAGAIKVWRFPPILVGSDMGRRGSRGVGLIGEAAPQRAAGSWGTTPGVRLGASNGFPAPPWARRKESNSLARPGALYGVLETSCRLGDPQSRNGCDIDPRKQSYQ
jgi:hypothetical protein